MAREFVMVADEVYRLQTGNDPECRWFQAIAEQGHYAGRTQPSTTRQGIYAAAPNGTFLGSLNSNDPERVARMMRDALERWRALPLDERRNGSFEDARGAIQRKESKYPTGGLVLQQFSRDLPRATAVADWRSLAWNQDFVWFKREEVRSLVPEPHHVGATRDVPRALVERLVRSHLVDHVRGQTIPYQNRDVKLATMQSEIVAVEGKRLTLRLSGSTRAVAQGKWPVNGFRDMANPQPRERGVETQLIGVAVYDTAAERFVLCDMVAVGKRWGGTQYNGRHDDLEEAPIGFAFRLAGEAPADRVAPELFYSYGW